MVYKKLLFTIYIVATQCIVGSMLYAQNTNYDLSDDIFFMLKSSKKGEGKINISQDVLLNNLVYKHKQQNKNNLKGYRIQIYRGTGSNARNEANNTSIEFMQNFSEFNTSQVYAIYETPYFKLRVGDYRNKNEAFEDLFKIKKIFPNAYIVNSAINYPKL